MTWRPILISCRSGIDLDVMELLELISPGPKLQSAQAWLAVDASFFVS